MHDTPSSPSPSPSPSPFLEQLLASIEQAPPGETSAPRVRRTPRRRRSVRRRALCDSALAVFREHGIEAATVGQIAARAGLGRTGFYRFFDSKDAVLRAVQDDLLATLVLVVRRRVDGADAEDWFARADVAVAATLRYLAGHLDTVPVMTARTSAGDPLTPLIAGLGRVLARAEVVDSRRGAHPEVTARLLVAAGLGGVGALGPSDGSDDTGPAGNLAGPSPAQLETLVRSMQALVRGALGGGCDRVTV